MTLERLIVVSVTGRLKRVPSYVIELLDRLRPHAERLVVVTPRDFKAAAPTRGSLDDAADSVFASGGSAGIADALRLVRTRLGAERFAAYEEIVWLDDSIFGPIGELRGLPAPAVVDGLDGWTLVPPDSADGEERCELHWVAVRGSSVSRDEFWDIVDRTKDAKEPKDDTNARDAAFRDPSGLNGFLSALKGAGFEFGTVHDRRTEHEVYLLRDSLPRYLEEGLPFVPWKALTMPPLLADRWAIVPRETYDTVVARGYPETKLWDFLLAVLAPRDWYTNLAMAEVLASASAPREPVTLRTAVLIHCFYVDMTTELLAQAAKVPGEVRLVITTDTGEKQAAIREIVEADARFADFDVRVVTSNRGRDITAFLFDCADVLRDPEVDLIVKLHSKKSVQDPGSVSGWFRRHLFENLFDTPDYTRNVIELFEREPLLGMVFPPTVHMGLPTMGHAWNLNKAPALGIAHRLGVAGVPFDATTPLSPFGSMFIARRAALTPILDANFIIEEFPDNSEYRDGSLAHVLERLVSYVAFSRGYYAKTVQTMELAGLTQAVLEYKLQAIGQFLPAHTIDQVRVFTGKGEVRPVVNAAIQHVRQGVMGRSPRIADGLSQVMRIVRSRLSR